MAKEDVITTHSYNDPFDGKPIRLVTYKESEVETSKDIILSSRVDFETLLRKVKQFNNDPTHKKENRSQRIINI